MQENIFEYSALILLEEQSCRFYFFTCSMSSLSSCCSSHWPGGGVCAETIEMVWFPVQSVGGAGRGGTALHRKLGLLHTNTRANYTITTTVAAAAVD